MNMTGFSALYKKELMGYLYSLLSYIFIIVFLVSLSWIVWQNIFLAGQATMRDFFHLAPWFFLFLLPALSMRLWSEEKRQGTVESLLTLPISDWQAVFAKWLAASTFFAVVLCISLPLPLTLSRLGNLDWGPVIGSYIGAWLFGSALLALGQWVSSFTKNQIVSFLVSIVVAFVFMLFGMAFFTQYGGILGIIFYTLSTYTHFLNTAKGVIDLRDVVYYLSFISVFLFLNVQTLAKRKRSVYSFAKPVLVIAVIVGLNIVMTGIHARLDLTQNKQYTLSEATKNTVRNLPETVTIKIYFSEDVPQNLIALRRDVQDLVYEYAQAGGQHVAVEFIDPKGNADAEEELQQYGITPIQFNVTSNEKFEVSSGYAGMALVYKEDHQVIPVISNTTNLEYDMTAAIQKMSRDQEISIGFLSDHGVGKTQSVQKYFAQQYKVIPVTLDTLETSAVQNLVIAGPTEAFSTEDQYRIDQFMMHGGNVTVLLDGMNIDEQIGQVAPNKTELGQLLSAYGVTVNTDVVADFTSPETLQLGNGPLPIIQSYPLWPRITHEGVNADHPITAQLQQITLPWPSSLSVEQKEGSIITELVHTTNGAHAFTELQSIAPDAISEPSGDQLSSKVLALLISGTIRSAFTDKEKPKLEGAKEFAAQTDTGQLFVVGNSRFASDDLLQGSIDNALLFVNGVDALAQDESLITIRSRNALSRPLEPMSDVKKTITKYVNIFSSVIIVVVIAGYAMIVRRRQDRKARILYSS